jgi:galactose oxidase-like protein
MPSRSSPRRLISVPGLVLVTALLLVVGAQAQPVPRHSGRWSEPKDWIGTAISLALLPGDPAGSPPSHSKIVWWRGSPGTMEGGIRLWQTTADTFCAEVLDTKFEGRTLPHPGYDIFCAGHGQLPSGGGLLVAGGTSVGEAGIIKSSIFDPWSETWNPQADMSLRRWYPSVTGALPDGRSLVGSGSMFHPLFVFGGSPTISTSQPTDSLFRLGLTESGDWIGPLFQEGEPGVDRPEPRTGHTEVAFAPNLGRYVFGGRRPDGAYLKDTWTPDFDLQPQALGHTYDWLRRHNGTGLSVPLGRMQHVAAMIAETEMIVFGGFGKNTSGQDDVFKDVWRFSGPPYAWNELDQSPPAGQTGHPGERYGHTAMWDGPRSRILIFGGAKNTAQTLADDEVYALTISAGTATWSKPPLRNPTIRPGARMGHAWTIDPFDRDRDTGSGVQKEHRILMFGGRVPGGTPALKDDLWTLWIAPNGDLEWKLATTIEDPDQPLGARTPVPRADHSLTYDAANHRLIVYGGDNGNPTTSDNTLWAAGVKEVDEFQWDKLNSMAFGRNGHTASFIGNVLFARQSEIFTLGAGSWQRRDDATLSQSYFPFNFASPGTGADTVFSVGPASLTYHMNTTSGAWSALASSSGFVGGSAVMYRPGKVMKCGTRDEENPALEAVGTTKMIDLAPGLRTWQSSGSMMFGRVNHNLTVLPTGEVLVSGGTSLINNGNAPEATARKQPELWDPTYNNGQGIWYGGGLPNPGGTPPVLASDPMMRDYHGNMILLPDGRTLSAGGNKVRPDMTTDRTKVTVYSPPYLFDGQGRVVGSPGCTVSRPVFSTPYPPSTLKYGESFMVNTTTANAITSVCLIKPGSATHGYDQNQRFVPLAFEILGTTALNVLAPRNGNDAPPGDYLLFIVNSDQVPAIARWVNLGNCTPVPCDTEPPPKITNFYPDVVGPNGIWLAWSAPGDNLTLTPGEYDLRYQAAPIPSENVYAFAEQGAGEPTVAPAGTGISYAVLGLPPCTEYWFALKTRDGRGHWSARSDAVSASTMCGGGGGFSARRVWGDREGAGASPSAAAIASSEAAEVPTGSGGTASRAPEAAPLALQPGGEALVVETTRTPTEGWNVTLSLQAQAEGLDPADAGVIVSQVRDEYGAWRTLGRYRPAPDQSPLGLCALRDGGRIVLPPGYGLDRVASALRSGSQEYRLADATHSRLGTLGGGFLAAGGAVDLAAGDAVNLAYGPTEAAASGPAAWYLVIRKLDGTEPAPQALRPSLGARIPTSFRLGQNVPNPFSATTAIAFDLPVPVVAKLEVFDLLGRRIVTLAEGPYPAGFHTIAWDHRDARGVDVPAGVYLYRLIAGSFRVEKRMVLLD